MTAEEAIKKAACGDANAEQFLFVLWRFAHTIDDLYDDPARNPLVAGNLTAALIIWTETVAANPFFQAYRDMLLGALRVALLQWASSEDFAARGGVRDKIISGVIKSGYQDLVFLVASITGGPLHALELQKEFRDYDFD